MNSKHLILNKSGLFNDYFLNDERESIFYLPNFNGINVIIGANNSGKSRFMRYLLSLDKLEFINDNIVKDYNSAITDYNNKDRRDFLVEQINFRDLSSIIQSNRANLSRSRYSIENTLQSKLSSFDQQIITIYDKYSKYYIPTLRTAHSLFLEDNVKMVSKVEKDIYFDTLNKYYSFNQERLDVFTGLHLYKDILNARNSKRDIRESFEKFEKFISRYFFNNKNIDIVAEFSKDNSLLGKNDSEIISVHIEGERDRSLFELGDGIQAIIILMYKVFMAKPKSYIFIDEPELNLHPGMQRLFLEQISTNPELKEKDLTYIISTHSNHFLDLTLEKENVSIYSFAPRKSSGDDKQFTIKNVNRGDNEILKHLGVNNSSVFMANCSIWLEGVSDRNYVKAFLKSYLAYLSKTKSDDYKSLKEDIDYAFFEYAGSNIEHYIFEKEISNDEESQIITEINALALSNKIFLLADSDNAEEGSAKEKRLKRLEAIKGDNFTAKIIREVRESENLLTNGMWESVLINFCNKNLLKNHREEIKGKISNAFNKIEASSYKTDYIGKFLNEINKKIGKIGEINVLNQIFEKKGSVPGTLIPKKELSQYILEADFDWEIFAENKEIVNLTEEIYQFIIDSIN